MGRWHIYSLVGILLLSLALNLWGIGWDRFARWHPDELTSRAESMLSHATLNHHFFAYGGLPHYQLIIIAVLPVKALGHALPYFDESAVRIITTALARGLSALLATVSVFSVFIITKKLFNSAAGLIAAALLAVSMGFVNIAHFATADIPSLFWSLLAALAVIYVLASGRREWYVVAGILIGFAAATKYVGGLVIVMLIAAHLSRRQRTANNLFIGFAAAAFGFIIANPVTFLSFCEYSEGFLKETLFKASRGGQNIPPGLPLMAQLRNAMGTPLFFLGIAGLLYSGHAALRNRAIPIIMVWSFLFPYYLLMARMDVDRLRFVIPLIPPLLILSGLMLSDFITARLLLVRFIGYALFIGIFSYSLLYTIAADLSFTHDARRQVRSWVNEHIAAGTALEVTSYVPQLPEGRYRITYRPHNNLVASNESQTFENPLYHTLQSFNAQLQAIALGLRLCVGEAPHYLAWYERATDRYRIAATGFDESVLGIRDRHSEYFIASSLYYDRFVANPDSTEGQFFTQLLVGESTYKNVATLHYQWLPWFAPQVEFINPTINIFRATTAQ